MYKLRLSNFCIIYTIRIYLHINIYVSLTSLCSFLSIVFVQFLKYWTVLKKCIHFYTYLNKFEQIRAIVPGNRTTWTDSLRSERAFDGWLGWPADDEHLFTFEVAEGCTRWKTARILTRKSWKAIWSTWDYKTPFTWTVSTAAINIDRVIIGIELLTADISRRAISDRRWHR